MDYRDERDALRARVESLEGELASARAETERMRATENALHASQRENEKLRAEVRRLMPTAIPPRPQETSAGRAAIAVGASIALITVAAGVAVGIVTRRAAEPEVVVVDPGPPVPPKVAEPPADPPPAPKPPKAAAAPIPDKPAAPDVRQVKARWTARVVTAESSPLTAGAPCVIQAVLIGDGRAVSPGDIEVTCSGKTLYRSTDQFDGVSSTSSGVEQSPGSSPQQFQYSLVYADQGARSGRAEVTIDTAEQTATVWRDGSYRVKIAVDELSAPLDTALIDPDESTTWKPMRRTGKVKAAQGIGFYPPGTACTVTVRPNRGEPNCRVRIRCSGSTVYGEGSGGYAECTNEGTQLLTAQDPIPSSQDHDPQLEINAVVGTVSVSDDGATPWSLKIALDPEKR